MIYTIWSDDSQTYIGWSKTLEAAIKRAREVRDGSVCYESSGDMGYANRKTVWSSGDE